MKKTLNSLMYKIIYEAEEDSISNRRQHTSIIADIVQGYSLGMIATKNPLFLVVKFTGSVAYCMMLMFCFVFNKGFQQIVKQSLCNKRYTTRRTIRFQIGLSTIDNIFKIAIECQKKVSINRIFHVALIDTEKFHYFVPICKLWVTL